MCWNEVLSYLFEISLLEDDRDKKLVVVGLYAIIMDEN